jgi:ATP-dependent helicase/nuclease subunit A
MELYNKQKSGVYTLDKDICVSASAGSGKTFVLVERFVNLVKTNKLNLNEILCITFTNKAANEMRDRIKDRFVELNRFDLIDQFCLAHISTFHSFCAKVLRNFQTKYSNFKIIQDNETEYLAQKIFNEILNNWEREKQDKYNILRDTLSFSKVEFPLYYTNPIIDDLITTYNEMRSLGIKPNEIFFNFDEKEINDLKNKFLEIKTKDLVLDLELLNIDKCDFETISKLKKINKKIHLNVKNDLKEILKNLKKILEKIIGLKLNIISHPTRLIIKELLVDFENAYSKFKNRENFLDFSDLETITNELLQNALILNKIKENFKYILVDEFQDTNELQTSILNKLRKPNNLFIVGDTKQSIYEFRGANSSILKNYESDFINKGALHINLNISFRSSDKILAVINFLFKKIFSNFLAYEDIEPVRERSDNKIPVSLILINAESQESGRIHEANIISTKINELVNIEKFSYKDIAILFRSTSDIKIYEKSLKKNNIPYLSQSGRGFYETREIVNLINFLKTLDNPYVDKYLVATLASEFFDFTMDEIYNLYELKGQSNKTLFEILLERKENNKISKFFLLFYSLERLKNIFSISELIIALSDKLEIKKYSNIQKFIEIARTSEEKGFYNLTRFLELISDYRENKIKEKEVSTTLINEERVKLLTIHQSKGLEFPVVFVADLGRSFRTNARSIFFTKENQITCKIYNSLECENEIPENFINAMNGKKAKEAREYERLLYVATTRARDYLFLSGVNGEKSNSSHLKLILDNLDIDVNEQTENKIINIDQNAQILFSNIFINKKQDKNLIIQKNDFQNKSFNKIISKPEFDYPTKTYLKKVYTVSEILTYLYCPRLYWMQYIINDAKVLFERAKKQNDFNHETNSDIFSLDSTSCGILTHRVFEKYNLGDDLDKIIIEEINKFNIKNLETKEKVKEYINNFYKHEFTKKIKDSKLILKEYPVISNVFGINLSAQIDLAFLYNNNLIIIDYKSSNVSKDLLEDKINFYKHQLILYSKVLEQLFNFETCELYLFFMVPDVLSQIQYNKPSIEETKNLVSSFLLSLSTKEFKRVDNDKCELCRYKNCS